ncbi:MAG: DUF4493 domain-containing protein [Bacteroidaceae bacterium]|nr:DUF4493 domain-containing protein [Bacteroidaceae bacterium]
MKNTLYLFALVAMVLFASCTNENEKAQADGYLNLSFNTVNVTNSRAIPDEYNAKQLAVKIVNKATGVTVKSTADHTQWANTNISLAPGTYTVTASSSGWDGNDSGRDVPYYSGSTDVTITSGTKTDASIVCRLANVKVSVNFDQSILDNFASATVEVNSAVSGIDVQTFVMGETGTMKPAYFPVGNLTVKLTVVNKAGTTHTMDTPIENVNARDHFILNYTTAGTGTGGITITADDEEKIFSYNFVVPTEASTILKTNAANAWSNFAYLEGTVKHVKTVDDANVKMLYKKSADTDWTTVATTKEGDLYKAKATSLAPSTEYSFKIVYTEDGNTFESQERTFTTENAAALPNGNMDYWHDGTFNNKTVTYPNANGDSFWDTSNPGSATASWMVTTQETTDVHTAGGSAACLTSTNVVIKFAAASLYAGSFGKLNGTSGASINFGQPWSSRPTQLKGWFKYSTGPINYYGGAPAGVTITKGETLDLWSAYIVLADEGYTFDNTNIAGTAWNYATDSRVIAYGALADDKCVSASEWTEFTIDLDYRDLKRKPKTIMVVFSSSKYGDYFTGYGGPGSKKEGSKLLLDDLELVYGEPSNN